MKKISHILVFPPFSAPYIGGIVSHSEEFAQAFAARDIKVTMFVPLLPSLPQVRGIHNIRRIYYPAIEPILHFPVPKVWTLAFWHSLRQLEPCQYDCVFSRTRFFPITFITINAWELPRLNFFPVSTMRLLDALSLNMPMK